MLKTLNIFLLTILCIFFICLYKFRDDKEVKFNKEVFLNNSNIGFIILRHVNNELTNNYWNFSYDCIRKYYPENLIIIIDDNSNYQYVNERILYKTTVINSEYKGRGEILPYYYYLQNKLFDTAVILHDSVFINQYIDFYVNKYKFIWHFNNHEYDQIDDETKMIKLFNDDSLLKFYENKELWRGCFGALTIIKHDYLTFINNKYEIKKLLESILNRYNRCSFERVIACLLQKNDIESSLLGDIHNYCQWGITFDQKDNYKHLPIIKVWTGR
jgi:hypothetical protein